MEVDHQFSAADGVQLKYLTLPDAPKPSIPLPALCDSTLSDILEPAFDLCLPMPVVARRIIIVKGHAVKECTGVIHGTLVHPDQQHSDKTATAPFVIAEHPPSLLEARFPADPMSAIGALGMAIRDEWPETGGTSSWSLPLGLSIHRVREH